MPAAVDQSPPARRLERPRWLDPRLLGGLALVLAAVVLGAWLLGSDDDRDLVWSASRDLAAGTTVEAADLQATSVRLTDVAGAYVDARGAPPVGYVLVRDVGAGELLPLAALTDSVETTERRLVSVPVEAHHYPTGLSRGQRVDVYVVRAVAPGSTETATPELVLASAVVAQVTSDEGGFGVAGSTGFVLEVDRDDVPAVVAAVAAGSMQLVRVPNAGSSQS